jgi:hypothetical protein
MYEGDREGLEENSMGDIRYVSSEWYSLRVTKLVSIHGVHVITKCDP